MKKIILNYATFEDYGTIQEFDLGNYKKSVENLCEFIDEKYCGKNKKRVFIAMAGSETTNYFISSDYLAVIDYFFSFDSKGIKTIHNQYFLFEEDTYENAFKYCLDHCEIHELGLNQ